MDRIYPRCWFNKQCTDMVSEAVHHDLVVKNSGPAPCILEVSTPTTDSTAIAGNYTQISPTKYTNLAKTTDKIEFKTGCGWYLNRDTDALYRTSKQSNCSGAEQDDHPLEKLYVNTCSGTPGIR